jgi:hypothetical protein
MISNFITHLDLVFNKNLLIDEANKVNFEPFPGFPQLDSWFNNPSTWLIGKVENLTICPEVNTLLLSIKHKLDCSDVRPYYYKQEANSEVPTHKDYNTQCSINIILSEIYTPIVFENYGEIKYTCALLNLQEQHSVSACPDTRLLIKFSIFDKTYHEAQQSFITKT